MTNPHTPVSILEKMKRFHLHKTLFLFNAVVFSSALFAENEGEPPAETNPQENPDSTIPTNEVEDSDGAVSAMPPRREKRADIPNSSEQEIRELLEVEVKEDIGPDPRPLLDDPLILKTEKDRKRELIDKHMDLASQILNSWTIPFLGKSLAEYAEEAERREKLEVFKQEQERNLEVLKKVNKELYREKREEYYDTVIRAQGDRWQDPLDSSF